MRLKLISKKREKENVWSFLFKPKPEISWQAGQYLRYKIADPKADERGENRYFTIASSPFEKNIQITTRLAGEKGSTFKKDLNRLKIGEEITGSGPLGNFVVNDPKLEYVFIAGGIGITPLHSIILDLNHRKLPINITLLYANRTEDIVFKKELEEIASTHPEFKIHYFIGDNKIDQKILQLFISTPKPPTFYISGPEPMMQSFEKLLKEMEVPDEQIRHDYFPGYSQI